jgi:hypothetical protein
LASVAAMLLLRTSLVGYLWCRSSAATMTLSLQRAYAISICVALCWLSSFVAWVSGGPRS